MRTTTRSILRVSALGFGGLLAAGLPARAARAAEPATAAEMQAKAERYRADAEHYRSLGGVGYKTGAVQRADRQATRYEGLATALASPPTVPIRSTEIERYADLAARYRALGGVGYKTGLVQWAEGKQRYFESPYATTTPPPEERPACLFISKPTVQWVACTRGE